MNKLEDSGGNKDAVMSAAPEKLELALEHTVVQADSQRISPDVSTPTAEALGLSAKYEILSVIGQGGMSVVYKARHRFTEQVLAIKMLKSESLDKTQLGRFIQEARAMEKLDHPNIVSARDVDYTSHGKPYLAMLFLEGSSLGDRIKQQGPVEVRQAIKIFMQCCDALEHAHKNGVVHRDLKPSNIMVVNDDGKEDVAKIVDFGIAKVIQENEANSPALTRTGEVFGSPLYMSPEQCVGQQLDERSDVYSFGCVMYETLTGHPPFEGGSSLEVIRKHIEEMAQPLSIPNCAPAICKRLDHIIYKAMEKDPARRYHSMAALKRDLEELDDVAEYKLANGISYVDYARTNRRIMKAIVRHPFRLSAVVASAVAAVGLFVWTTSYIVPLTVTPVPMENYEYVWDEAPVNAKPLDYDDTVRKANYIINESIRRVGATPDTFRRRHKLAAYQMRYGDFPRAAALLEQIADGWQNTPGYGPNAWETLDALQECAICEYRIKDYSKAANLFGEALARFEETRTVAPHAVGECFAPKLELRLADSLRLSGQYEKARKYYLTALSERDVRNWHHFKLKATKPEQRDVRFWLDAPTLEALGRAGLADCDLHLAEMKGYDKIALLQEAKMSYARASEVWKQESESNESFLLNVSMCQNGIANADIMEGNYARAATRLKELVAKNPGKLLLDEQRFRLNFARTLWHAHEFGKAYTVANKLS